MEYNANVLHICIICLFSSEKLMTGAEDRKVSACGRSYNNKAFIIIITKRGRAASVVDKDGFALGKDTMGTVGCFKGQN